MSEFNSEHKESRKSGIKDWIVILGILAFCIGILFGISAYLNSEYYVEAFREKSNQITECKNYNIRQLIGWEGGFLTIFPLDDEIQTQLSEIVKQQHRKLCPNLWLIMENHENFYDDKGVNFEMLSCNELFMVQPEFNEKFQVEINNLLNIKDCRQSENSK